MTTFSDNDKKIIAIFGILAGIISLSCLLIGLHATHYDAEAFTNPVKILDIVGINANHIRAFMISDLFGYYLLLTPVILYVHHQLKGRTAFAPLLTAFGFGYVFIGSIGAAVLATVWPSLIERYHDAMPATKEILRNDFILTTDVVIKGMWNYLEVLLGGVWWFATGWLVNGSRALKSTTVILGVACILDSVGELLRIPIIAETGLNIYLVLAIVWPIWVGVAILRKKF